MNKGKIGETYNIGSNERINNVNILKIILDIISRNLNNNNHHYPVIKKVIDRPGHDLCYKMYTIYDDITTLKQQEKFNAGLAKTISYYKLKYEK